MLLQLRSKVPEIDRRRGEILTEADVDLLVQQDSDVYRPDGEPLLLLRRGAIPEAIAAQAYPSLRSLRSQKTSNRGLYSGEQRVATVFADGRQSRTTVTSPISSAIIGYFDRQGGRFPFCRATAFTAQRVAEWEAVVPLAEHVAGLFSQAAPARYRRQLEAARSARPEYVITGTPFTTLTVNNDVAPSGNHRDAGDFKAGLGVISVFRRGEYDGALLVFPEYRVGVDLHDRDVLFFNSHDWHGVTRLVPRGVGETARISVVYYLRQRILRCRSPSEEIEHAKSLRGRIKRGG